MTLDATASAPAHRVSKRLRFEVLRRDNHACRYCGAAAPDVKLVVDHVVPVALGGTNDPSNLVTACGPCNSGKSSTSPDERTVADVSDLALRMAQALEQAAKMRRADIQRQHEIVDVFDKAWLNWHTGGDPANKIPRDSEWRNSIATFVSAGLDESDLLHFVRVAMKSRCAPSSTWKYFCGCCWKEITKRQELAQQMMTQPAPRDPQPDLPVEMYADPDCSLCDGSGVDASDGRYSDCYCLNTTPYGEF